MENLKNMTIGIIPSHSKCGYDLIRLLVYFEIRVIAFTTRNHPIALLRSQLDARKRHYLYVQECDITNITFTRTAILRTKVQVGTVDYLIVPLPSNCNCDEAKSSNGTCKQKILLPIDETSLQRFFNDYVFYLMPPVQEERIWMVYYSYGNENDVLEHILRELLSISYTRVPNPITLPYSLLTHPWKRYRRGQYELPIN